MTPPPDDKFLGWLGAVKGLTLSNVLVIALLAIVGVPIYVIYRALNDASVMDRLTSVYDEISNQNVGCALRHARERNGPDQWGISTGFAFTGDDKWFVNVVIDHEPDRDELVSYCEALKLIADEMLAPDVQ